jgi:hypothetical protein
VGERGMGEEKEEEGGGGTAARRRCARASEQQHPSLPLHHDASLAQNVRDDHLFPRNERSAHRHSGDDSARGRPNIIRVNRHGCTSERDRASCVIAEL